MIATRRLAGTRPDLAGVAGIVYNGDLWQLCRDDLTGVEVRIDGWDIAAAGSAWSSGPCCGSGSCGAARRFPGE